MQRGGGRWDRVFTTCHRAAPVPPTSPTRLYCSRPVATATTQATGQKRNLQTVAFGISIIERAVGPHRRGSMDRRSMKLGTGATIGPTTAHAKFYRSAIGSRKYSLLSSGNPLMSVRAAVARAVLLSQGTSLDECPHWCRDYGTCIEASIYANRNEYLRHGPCRAAGAPLLSALTGAPGARAAVARAAVPALVLLALVLVMPRTAVLALLLLAPVLAEARAVVPAPLLLTPVLALPISPFPFRRPALLTAKPTAILAVASTVACVCVLAVANFARQGLSLLRGYSM
jgi:hypothetical protein